MGLATDGPDGTSMREANPFVVRRTLIGICGGTLRAPELSAPTISNFLLVKIESGAQNPSLLVVETFMGEAVTASKAHRTNSLEELFHCREVSHLSENLLSELFVLPR